jgi:hypothetical protein
LLYVDFDCYIATGPFSSAVFMVHEWTTLKQLITTYCDMKPEIRNIGSRRNFYCYETNRWASSSSNGLTRTVPYPAKPSEDIQNHLNGDLSAIEQGEIMYRKHRRLKFHGGQAYGFWSVYLQLWSWGKRGPLHILRKYY